jgi:phosphopantothenate synthetase
MRYPELTDEEIEKLIDAVGVALTNMKCDNRKNKLKIFGKTLLTIILVAGGITVSIMFPNPITIGVLGGAAALIAGNKGVLRKVKNMKEKSKIRKKNKEDMKNMIVEQHNRKMVHDVQSRINSQQSNGVPEPSAPKLYPDLNQFKG